MLRYAFQKDYSGSCMEDGPNKAKLKAKRSEKQAVAEVQGNALQYSCLENPMDGGAW